MSTFIKIIRFPVFFFLISLRHSLRFKTQWMRSIAILHDSRKGRISGHIGGGFDGTEGTKRISSGEPQHTQHWNIL